VAFGPGVTRNWPLAAAGTAGLFLASVALLLAAWHTQPERRSRTIGLLAFLAGVGIVAVLVGWGRAALDLQAGLASRYAVLAAPWVCAAYFAWGLYGGRSLGRFAQTGFFLLAALLLVLNSRVGKEAGRARSRCLDTFEQDVRAGVPVSVLVARHSKDVFGVPERMTGYLRLLHDDGIGYFGVLKEDGVPLSEERGVRRRKTPPEGGEACTRTAEAVPGPREPDR